MYRVRYPFTDLPPTRLVLTTPSRVFDRAVSVVVAHEADLQRRDPWIETLAQAKWVHAMQDRPALPLTMSIPTLRVTDLIVVVDEGDNSPLPIDSARILLPSYRLRLFREQAAPLRLVYGRDDLSPPQYDLALLAPQVLGASAEEVVAGPEQPLGAGSSQATGISPRLFWAVLGAAVIVLLTLIGRLLKKSDLST